jgi:hypothetical protein
MIIFGFPISFVPSLDFTANPSIPDSVWLLHPLKREGNAGFWELLNCAFRCELHCRIHVWCNLMLEFQFDAGRIYVCMVYGVPCNACSSLRCWICQILETLHFVCLATTRLFMGSACVSLLWLVVHLNNFGGFRVLGTWKRKALRSQYSIEPVFGPLNAWMHA